MGEEMVDQVAVAETVSEKINLEMFDAFLIKPLDPIMVKKEFSKPVVKGESEQDGVVAKDYDEVETEVKEVEADFRKGIVLKVPASYKEMCAKNENFIKVNIGDTIIFPSRAARYFDLFKDSALIRIYDIVAVER